MSEQLSHDGSLRIELLDEEGNEALAYQATAADVPDSALADASTSDDLIEASGLALAAGLVIPDREDVPAEWRGLVLDRKQIAKVVRLRLADVLVLRVTLQDVAPARPAQIKVLEPKEFVDTLKELGIVPPNCRRIVIDAEAGKPVMIYYDTFADERLLTAFRAPTLRVAIEGLGVVQAPLPIQGDRT